MVINNNKTNIKNRMNYKVIISVSIFIFFLILFFYIKFYNEYVLKLEIKLKAERTIDSQLKYTYYNNKNKIKTVNEYLYLEKSDQFKLVSFNLSKDINRFKSIMIDFGENENLITISEINISGFLCNYKIYPSVIPEINNLKNVYFYNIENKELTIRKNNSKVNIFYDNFNNDVNNIINSFNKFYLLNIILIFILVVSIIIIYSFIFIKSHVKSQNYSNILISISFLIILLLPIFSNLIGFKRNNIELEKRKKVKMPDFSLYGIFKYPEKFDRFYKDNFGLRNSFIKMNNYTKIKLFKTVPSQANVVIGKNGWLFYTNDQCIEDYRGLFQYSEEELIKIKNNLEKKRDWLKERGIEYYLFVPPNKHSVYYEFIPEKIKIVNNNTRFDQIKNYLNKNSDIEIIDIREDFLKIKDKQQLYYKTDTHWNSYGAFIGFSILFDKIRKNFPQINENLNIDDYEITNQVLNKKTRSEDKQNLYTNIGDLSNLLSVDFYDDICYLYKRKKEININIPMEHNYNYLNLPSRPVVITEAENKKLPKAVVFHDSFFTKFFSEQFFSRGVYVWTEPFNKNSYFNKKLIEEEKPDLVLDEAVERYLNFLVSVDIDEL